LSFSPQIEVLVARYGNHILHKVDWSLHNIPTSASNWWKNIVELEDAVPGRNWLSEAMVREVGNGHSTSFWDIKWIGDAPLSFVFPRLFSLSNQKNHNVSELLSNNGTWSFSWRRNLFIWEEDLIANLRVILEPVVLSLEEDCWKWKADVEGFFSVKSSYKLLSEVLSDEDGREEILVNVLSQIWESAAPSKVLAFSWQLLLGRIPTKSKLEDRGIVILDAPWECLGCVGKKEMPLHLFLHCPLAMKVWGAVFKWIGISIVIPPSLSTLFEIVKGSVSNKKIRKGFLVIWHASLWSIWKSRNNAIFASGSYSARDVLEDIKVLSWKWSLARLKIFPCMFYEWAWDPGDCLLR
jgi:hypothetical protein